MTGLGNTTLYNEDMKGITTSSSSFEQFIRGDMLYVDKTRYIYNLVKNPVRNFHFISRPRRFGKSLFCNTLESLFKGDKELFKGLYIYDKYDFKPYPVLHFDFSGGMTMLTLDGFLSSFRNLIRNAVKQFDIIVSDTDDPVTAFENVINEIHEKYGEMVIIIDEYDDPLITATLKNKPFLEDIREVFNSFCKTIKKNAGKIRFFFMTGVAKLSTLSIFSAMNNLVDLSMDKEFAGAFGYTDEELDEYFGEGIDEYLEANPGKYKSREEFREKIREYYDGYRFSPKSETRVYNPVSIGFFFNKHCEFDNYWIWTGSTSSAIALAKNTDLSKLFLTDEMKATIESFAAFDIADITDRNITRRKALAMLYYTGYISIERYDEPYLYLSFPNKEVAASFTNLLLERYSSNKEIEFNGWAKEFYDACQSGNEETLRKKLTEYFDAFSYELIGDEKEKFYHAIFHAIFFLTGVYSITEDRGLRGRADEVVITSDSLWIFELKVDGNAVEAIAQIESKGYLNKYAGMINRRKLKVHKVGISFSSNTRKIESWKCE